MSASRPGRTRLYRGGAIYSPADPFAEAMLVVGETVAWLGSDEAAAAHVDAADELIDLGGALVTPAFVDAHAHTTETGLALTGVDLTAASSVDAVLALVEAAARRGSEPILGHGWDERHWPEGRPPTRSELDRAAAGRQVYLARVDVHSAVVSTSLAQRHGLADLAGWSDSGWVQRDAHHAARALTRQGLGPGERQRMHEVALTAAAAAGIGCLHEMSAPHIAPTGDLGELLALVEARRSQPDSAALPDVVAYRGALAGDDTDVARLVAELDLPPGNRLAGLAGDLCVDGSVGSHTAAMRSPYVDCDTHGHAYLSAAQVGDHVAACTRAGLQAGFHVIGDAGVDIVVDGLQVAADVVGAPALRGCRHRLEHVELIDAQSIAALADLGVAASVQPAFDAAWGGAHGMYAERLGHQRAMAMNPLADLSRAGVPLALGSDSPVTPFDPWAGVASAVAHRNPAQRISAKAAFLAHTRGGWRLAGRDGQGVLVPGAPASYAVWAAGELVVQTPDERVRSWSTDPRSGTPGLPDVSGDRPRPRCLQTVIAGRVAHDVLR
ncbi:MAG: amidohydrolase family protein [Actinomycetota bacterium]|nr:amidohydrolase family protein [Actinomycetota bacterium]